MDHRPTFEFHILKSARDRYQINETLFSITGEVVFANFNASRELAKKLNEQRSSDKTVAAGELNAMGLLDEILHYLIETYREDHNPELYERMESYLSGIYGNKKLDSLLSNFVKLYPNNSVYNQKETESDYLKNKTGNLANRYVALEELMVLWLDNLNPAYESIKELIDESELKSTTIYKTLFSDLDTFFKTEPAFGPENLPLLEMLSEPAKKYPHSIMAQLDYIRVKWSKHLSGFLTRLLISMDFIREEQKARFDTSVFGHGPAPVIEFGGDYDFEPEQFSQDLDWMPKVVMIAKSTYVWLDQLSKQYKRPITRLDEIPDEELDRLGSYGFTGLWLIGLWERSRASERIKKMRGNPEAVASAYSLMAYDIAADLGGESAYQNLKDRAWKRGIRLASDMVPNHMGIDSNWVINHPNWFLHSDHPPFPTYQFTGQDLSDDDRVGIFIEDGYWTNSDAAVVFKRLDKHTGDVRYIYHGNDGTSMPWNDTAQLNYLMSEVREAVIQTILHVARKFPIIRFDAAMTLAKKHYQRLWFPQPGTGGDIPSRAEHALTKQRFDELFPIEFWREVVDRVAQEVPDTLLLAEAFWLMEGYFVRTLGMHCVYNSAFMNMLKKEENEKYRVSIKNVLEFNPQILKRHVNFMNNPDEETAVAQFGKDDKYFGVCVMMCTMPGLPMFGHGQIEGYTEKYGMEYKRAYWDETPDQWLIKRHEREIFPIIRRRRLFSDVENFLLYDFYTADGSVNENVFAYSNRRGHERSLVVYQNKFDKAAGWVKTSAAYLENEQLVRRTLGEGLVLGHSPDLYICFRDYITRLEYLRSSESLWENGLYIELEAFKYHVFLDFREVRHTHERPYGQLSAELNGQGVPSIDEALDELMYQPILSAFHEAVNPGSLRWLVKGNKKIKATFKEKLNRLVKVVSKFEQLAPLSEKELKTFETGYQTVLKVQNLVNRKLKGFEKVTKSAKQAIIDLFPQKPDHTLDGLKILLVLPFLDAVKKLYAENAELKDSFLDDRLYAKLVFRSFEALGAEKGTAWQETLLVKILTMHPLGLIIDKKNPALPFFEELFADRNVLQFIQVNEYLSVRYFNKEQFETLLQWLYVLRVFRMMQSGRAIAATKVNETYRTLQKMAAHAGAHGYRLDDFLKFMK